jgi:hypothetical protein
MQWDLIIIPAWYKDTDGASDGVLPVAAAAGALSAGASSNCAGVVEFY